MKSIYVYYHILFIRHKYFLLAHLLKCSYFYKLHKKYCKLYKSKVNKSLKKCI